MEVEPSPTSPAPLIQAEHSYSLSEEPRAQSPFTHVTSSDSFNDGKRGAGALAPVTRSPFSHVLTLRPALSSGCGEVQRGTGRVSLPQTVHSGDSLSLNGT